MIIVPTISTKVDDANVDTSTCLEPSQVVRSLSKLAIASKDQQI